MLPAGTTIGVGEIAHIAGKEAFDGVLHWTEQDGGDCLRTRGGRVVLFNEGHEGLCLLG
jgi:hypothetical protein